MAKLYLEKRRRIKSGQPLGPLVEEFSIVQLQQPLKELSIASDGDFNHRSLKSTNRDKLMNFIRRHWYDTGPVLAFIALVWLVVARMNGLQLIVMLNLIVLFFHQFEEYHWPGGFPWIFNEAVRGANGDPADRYLLNQNSAAFINLSGWAFYLLPVLFPGVIWLGLAQALFGLVGQVIFHGIVANLKLKTWYNPGLAAVLLGHVPLGIWYIVEANNQGLLHWRDWIFAALCVGFFTGFIMNVIGFRLLASKTSPYPFTPEELSRNNREERLRRIGITPYPLKSEEHADRS